jgi:two-component system, chemotaxis family, chemotaxis protein CheY
MTKRIIIVDDTAYMRAVIKQTLTQSGLQVVGEAEDGTTALNLYRQQQPDLIILNVVMPQVDGIETLKQIKAWDPHAKVLMCSAMGQAATVFTAIRAGASDFLVKPFDTPRLIEAISRVLSLKFVQQPE